MASLEALINARHAEKRQRTSKGATVELSPNREHLTHDRPQAASGESNPPYWKIFSNYTREKYQELKVKEQYRRETVIDIERLDNDHLRDGGEKQGWFQHWRRGLRGALQSWAKGSLGAIIYMLVACSRYFNVVDEVGAALGFLPKVHVRRAETCMYICDRIRPVLQRSKWCKTEEQRQDYHVIMTAVSPRRTESDADPDNMIQRVAAELGVRHGKKFHKPSGTRKPRAFDQCITRCSVWDWEDKRRLLNAKGRELSQWFVGSTVLC